MTVAEDTVVEADLVELTRKEGIAIISPPYDETAVGALRTVTMICIGNLHGQAIDSNADLLAGSRTGQIVEGECDVMKCVAVDLGIPV